MQEPKPVVSESEPISTQSFQDKPVIMTDVHAILLKQFWSEGMTPTPMVLELVAACPELSEEQGWLVVMHWMWSDKFRV
jgi:hypothetical protein